MDTIKTEATFFVITFTMAMCLYAAMLLVESMGLDPRFIILYWVSTNTYHQLFKEHKS